MIRPHNKEILAKMIEAYIRLWHERRFSSMKNYIQVAQIPLPTMVKPGSPDDRVPDVESFTGIQLLEEAYHYLHYDSQREMRMAVNNGAPEITILSMLGPRGGKFMHVRHHMNPPAFEEWTMDRGRGTFHPGDWIMYEWASGAAMFVMGGSGRLSRMSQTHF